MIELQLDLFAKEPIRSEQAVPVSASTGAAQFDWMGPEERARFHILREGRVNAHPGPLFPQ